MTGKLIRDIVNYSLIAAAFSLVGCAASKANIKYNEPKNNIEQKEIKDTTGIENKIKIDNDYHNPRYYVERENLMFFLGITDPTKKDYENLENLIKNSREDKQEILTYIGEKLEEMLFKEPAELDDLMKDKYGFSPYERQLVNLDFYLKASLKEDVKEAIKLLDTAIAVYPFREEPYELRAKEKLSINDYEGYKADCDMVLLLGFVNKKDSPYRPKKSSLISSLAELYAMKK